MIACYFGRTDLVKALLEKGADVNMKDKKGKTALIYATTKGKDEIVKILKQSGAQ